jgi:hypothetical protein
MGRVDYRSGLLFAAVGLPTVVLGALTTSLIPRRIFDPMFGVLMIAAAAFLAFYRSAKRDPSAVPPSRHMDRRLVERDGTVHTYSFDPRWGGGLSFLVGYLSSLMGIGGGIVHVPAMVHLLNFPVHVATATSHFVLMFMAFAASVVHLSSGALARDVGPGVTKCRPGDHVVLSWIKGTGAELVYFGGTTQTNGGQIAKDLKAAGLDVKFMGPDGCRENAFIESAGKDYIAVIKGLSGEESGQGTAWLQRVVDETVEVALAALK